MICRRILASGAYQDADTIFLFRAFRSEPDLGAVASQAEWDGKTVLYPVCTDQTHMLAVKPGAHWETDSFGISIPVLTEAEVFKPEAIDLILCPCSAFDDEGRRLGMGRGYYDRFLPQCTRAYKILVAFEAQQLEQVFTDEHDIPMDAVITESRTQFLR